MSWRPAWATYDPVWKNQTKVVWGWWGSSQGDRRAIREWEYCIMLSLQFQKPRLARQWCKQTVLEIGQLCSPSRALPLQFSVRPTGLFEVHPDETSYASRRSLTQAPWACALSSLPVLGSSIHSAVTSLWLSIGFLLAHIQDILSGSGAPREVCSRSCCPAEQGQFCRIVPSSGRKVLEEVSWVTSQFSQEWCTANSILERTLISYVNCF